MADENIVKRVCRELNITQRELAERMDIPESTIARWKSGDIPRLAELYLNALLENKKLKKQLSAIEPFVALVADKIQDNERIYVKPILCQ